MTIQIAGHNMYDNTRLSEYKRCPRKYYYRHVLNWVPEGKTPPALVFGSCWHAAMDVLWDLATQGKDPQHIVEMSMGAFMSEWESYGYPMDDSAFGTSYEALEPRTPMNAEQMLYNYLSARAPLLESVELVSVERPFVVPLSPDLTTLYIGKLDKVVKYEGNHAGIEHKTTSNYRKASGVNPAYMDSFSPNSQIDGYLHAGKMLYGNDFKVIYADAALVHKHVHDGFALQPVRKQTASLGEWLSDTTYWISRIEQSAETGIYPKNTNSCYDFNSACSYADLCRGLGFDNIKDRAVNGPMPGFNIEEWNPVEELRINVENLDAYMKSNEGR